MCYENLFQPASQPNLPQAGKKFSSFFQVLHLHQQAKDSRDQAAGQAKQFVDEKHPEWVSMARADLEEEDYTI